MKTIKIIIILAISFVFIANKNNAAIKDSIFATVGEKVITRSDIINEIKILLILNNTAYSQEIKEQLDQSAINSILKRTIKKIEIEKYSTLKFNQDDVDVELKKLAKSLNMDLDILKQTLITNEINISILIDQISTDLLWNSLIFNLYKDRLSINLNEVEDQLKTINESEEVYEYLISEIIVDKIPKEELQVKINEIYNKIEEIGFENYAMENSIADTALKGGDLGWIEENSISKEFKEKIINTPIGKISEPIILPRGILFFKVRDKKKIEEFVNLEDAKNQIVAAEKMKILNMYSLSHYDKLRRTITIVYY